VVSLTGSHRQATHEQRLARVTLRAS
jgi:hypothetical protein